MNERYALDTNVVIALLRFTPAIVSKIQYARITFVPSIVLGELYFGAYKSDQVSKNVEYADSVATNNPILVCDAATARIYGSIKNALRIKGQPIPENDLWIAALAIQHDLTLLTRDAHFARVENARIEQW